jgi:hypothetical protein
MITRKQSKKLNMKNRVPTIVTRRIRAGLLAVATVVIFGQKTVAAQTPVDPAHAAHVASGAMPPDAAKGDPALAQQVAQLQAKVAQLEAGLRQGVPPMAAAPAGATMPGMPAAAPAAGSAMGMGMDKMKSGGGMAGISSSATPPMAGMSGTAAPAGGMMGMMSQMMGMMDKMMSMGGGSAPMPSGGGSTPSAPAAGMNGSAMGMDQMEMAGMMGMGPMGAGAAGAMPQSALPGFPGSSHLYHIGATGFFLDHPQHIALTTQQQAALNKAKEQAALAKSTADRAVEQAEQELWALTAADQPDATAVQAKISAIGKLTGDSRFAFIRAVGDASKILTEAQHKILTGFAPPAPAASAAAPMAPMKDM